MNVFTPTEGNEIDQKQKFTDQWLFSPYKKSANHLGQALQLK